MSMPQACICSLASQVGATADISSTGLLPRRYGVEAQKLGPAEAPARDMRIVAAQEQEQSLREIQGDHSSEAQPFLQTVQGQYFQSGGLNSIHSVVVQKHCERV